MRVTVIGLDSSHGVEFPRRIHAPDCPANQRVTGMEIGHCLRFATPFTDETVLAERQQLLESWGVHVTEDFDLAVANADALMILINDGSRHLDYFRRCASLGLPIFLDKPMADCVASSLEIAAIAKAHQTRFFTASSLRFADEVEKVSSQVESPTQASVYGPFGVAPAGSSIIWYGVHSFEMLASLMGSGARTVTVIADQPGAVAVVEYANGRRGVVTLTKGSYHYGGVLRNEERSVSYTVDIELLYTRLLQRMVGFFEGETAPVSVGQSLDVMRLLEATHRAMESGKTQMV